MTSHEKNALPQDRPVLLFDGTCRLCCGWLNFIIARDRNNRLAVASLQSETGKRILAENRLPADFCDSIVLWEDGRCHFKSTAILKTLRKMDGLWPLLTVFMVIPTPLRDYCYDWVAVRRHRWSGGTDACPVPDAKLQSRLLD